MTTNKTQTKAKQSRKQSPSASAASLEAAPSAAADKAPVLSKPMTAAEFLAEQEQQRQERARRAGLEPATDPLVDSILQAQSSQTGPSPAAAQGQPKAHQTIKLGVDVHLDRYVVVRQIDGGAPQPGQRFSPADFVRWAKKQLELAQKVYSCYEAGPFGYSLHRQLSALGLTNYVVRPRDWDEYGQKVKTDQRDAKQLVLSLDRYVSGNAKAFCVVRVPTEAEEQARSRSRQRESLQKEKLRLAAQGRSHALYYGAHLEGTWWVESLWKELAVPPIVLELLEPLRRVIQALEQELKVASKALTQAAPDQLPMGLGKLTYEVLEREVGDWKRFENRRQVASYTGMCPREDSSAQRRFQGAINKHGNPRLRTSLVEASWRLVYFQPAYKPVAKWLPVLTHPKTTRAKRKQIIVAIGRQFSVDWWRVRTQRAKAEDLGLKTNPRSPMAACTPRGPTATAAVNAKL